MKRLLRLLFALLAIASITFAPNHTEGNSISLTEDEVAFLNDHPVVRLGVDPGFVPFEFIDSDGQYKGIAADFISLISQRVGIRFEVVQGLTWPEAYDMALRGDIDVLAAVSKTEEREQYFLFSDPYYYFARVIVTRDTDTGISTIRDLERSAVAVQRNSSHHSYLLSYPRISLSLYDSVEAALIAVANGTERAFVGNLATTNYLIRSTGLTNLRFTAFEPEKQEALYFAVRKDWPEFVSILNKALSTITQEERIAINNKWVHLQTQADYGPLIRIVLIICILAVVVIGVSFYWIIRLRNEIRKRELVQLDLERARQEAVAANEFKSNFLARMSHEIRTPLNAIMGLTYLLKRTEISPTQSLYVDRIDLASKNMLSIVNDILDFSKIEAGKVELEIAPFSIDQVIHDVVSIVSHNIEERQIEFKLFKDPLIPTWFLGDAKRIEQVLINILNNAVKFTSEGEVSLSIRLVAREGDKYHLSFSIKDTGIGMTEEQISKLFMPFVQGDSSIDRRFGGSGLGLSIAKNLVDLMGGQIQVFSTPGEGSTFVVNLSLLVDREKEEISAKILSANHFRGVRILVLARSAEEMSLIESYLSAYGAQCELTSSPASALSMLEDAAGGSAEPFDLFIVDYDTPQDGGFRFVESIRGSKIARMPKIIMLLPMTREDLFDELGERGVDIGIGKPIVPSNLLNAVLDSLNLEALETAKSQAAADKGTRGRHRRYRRTYTVLLAEDNKTNQLIAQTLLEQAGIKSIVADDGKSAVELYRQHKDSIDVILMDLHMPVMDGYEAAQEIRKLSASVPIVAMTADVILGVREKCEQNGIYHYISKPFDPDRFVQTIRRIIRSGECNESWDVQVLDRFVGLRNLGGDSEVYQEALNEFFSENRDTVDKLTLAVREGRYKEAAQVVHKVKGSLGSIGATALYDLSITLGKALNEENDELIRPLIKDFSCLMERLLVEIEESQGPEAIWREYVQGKEDE
ncbi:MAG: transporter substrate-binding domain-containing protein [Bacillota bacterium]|nr:transporter substrate-binding domain-containing protein [Bacillota bacterium]